jgi:hypothetical protein
MKDRRIAAFLTLGDGTGDGWGYGAGTGDGGGYGDGDGDGDGDGYGCGWGDGDGSGYGFSAGLGFGNGTGRGSGFYSGFGDGDIFGTGDGYGYGCGWGDGDGSGDGSGSLRYIKSFCGSRVYMIDDVPTLIDRVSRDVAKGRILRDDMTTTPCFLAKGDRFFAHGTTLRDAMDALREKQFKGMPEDERIEAFIAAHEHGKQYPCADLYDWHHKLTGSCEMGRREFAKAHGIDIEHDSMTVDEFIGLTRNAYGGTVIKKLEKIWKTTEAELIWKV